MKIKFIGTGGGLCISGPNYNSNIIIENNDKRLCVDFGRTAPEALRNAGLDHSNIDAIYISHLHSDHIGGLEWLAFRRYFGKFPFGTDRPRLYANGGIIRDLWNKSLQGGLESIQNKENNLRSYFDVMPVRPNGKFEWECITFRTIQMVHVVDDREIKPTYGLMIQYHDKKIFITTDTQFSPNQIMSYYRDADLIFHDCECAEYPESVHAQYHQLNTLDSKFKEKMYLYHYDGDISKFNAIEDGFKGFVEVGQEFDF